MALEHISVLGKMCYNTSNIHCLCLELNLAIRYNYRKCLPFEFRIVLLSLFVYDLSANLGFNSLSELVYAVDATSYSFQSFFIGRDNNYTVYFCF